MASSHSIADVVKNVFTDYPPGPEGSFDVLVDETAQSLSPVKGCDQAPAGTGEQADCEATSGRGVLSGAVSLGREVSDTWAAEIGRPMYATELLRHLELAESRTGSMRDFVRDSYGSQTQSFLAARQVYREYLGAELTEEEFLEKEIFTYVDDEDPLDFKRRTEDDIIGGDVYSKKMRFRLSSVFKRAFGEVMHCEDLDHCFQIAKISRATVSGDSANVIATCLNEELECISSMVTRVYQEVLGRQPDRTEVRDEVPVFRRNAPASFYTAGWGASSSEELRKRFEGPSDDLRRRLHSGLEFHDVLKRKIGEKTGTSPVLNNRDLFRALKAVLDRFGDDLMGMTRDGNPCNDEAVWTLDWSEIVG